MLYLNRYLKYQQRRKEAQQWIKAGGERVVANALFHLNRHARKTWYYRDGIYGLKSLLIEHWYTSGQCVAAYQQRQNLICWDCGGTGEDGWHDYDVCEKCNGTGVYRSHILYKFVFRFGGKFYNWHQPASIVDYPVRVANDYEAPDEYHGESPGHELSAETLAIYVTVLGEYLSMQGVIPRCDFEHVPKTLLGAVYQDIEHWFSNTKAGWAIWRGKQRVKRWHENIRALWHYADTGEMRPSPTLDDIPF